jgi:peptidoglycan/xylan/chitin deacetylase (PgdA/CDA1 family)
LITVCVKGNHDMWKCWGKRLVFLLLVIIMAVVTAYLSYGKVWHHLEDSPGSTSGGASGGWQSALRDEDRHLPTIIPTLPRTEAVISADNAYCYRGDPAKKQVALTFDDGPIPGTTEQLLAILKQYHVKATFFEGGEQATAHPELVRAGFVNGQCIAVQIATPRHLPAPITPALLTREMRTCVETLRSITGQPPRFVRPLRGALTPGVTDAATALGLQTVLWTTDTGEDQQSPPMSIATKALTGIENGTIIRLHDGMQSTIAMLPLIITQLQARGFALVTLDQMRVEPGAPSQHLSAPHNKPNREKSRSASPISPKLRYNTVTNSSVPTDTGVRPR